jgi:hypothetical protein
MESIEFLLELSASIILLIGFGYVIGHLLKIDKFSHDQKNSQQIQLRKTDVSKKEPGNIVQDNEL